MKGNMNLDKRERTLLKAYVAFDGDPASMQRGLIVTTADKYCSLLETMKFHREHRRYIANKKSGRSFHKEGMTVQCQG